MTEIGHNAVPAGAEVVKSLVERIEKLEAEKKSYADDIREVYSEAKDKGINVSALRTVIGKRRKEKAKRLEHEAAVEAIEHKLGMR